MPLFVNLRHLADRNVILNGELPASDLDIDSRDEMIHFEQALAYELEVQKLDQSLLVRGQLRLTLNCECVRCLKAFTHRLEIEDWTCHIPLASEERAPVVSDCVDLTPYVREDILLAFPQHPLCNAECRGLEKPDTGKVKQGHSSQTEAAAWAELDKLKL